MQFLYANEETADVQIPRVIIWIFELSLDKHGIHTHGRNTMLEFNGNDWVRDRESRVFYELHIFIASYIKC